MYFFFVCLNEKFCRYMLGSFDSQHLLVSLFFLFSLCLNDFFIGESRVLKSPTINMGVSLCDLTLVMFLLPVWVFLHLGYRCSELRHYIGGGFL